MNTSSILLVDDEAAQREILAGYLKKKKHLVYLASSADEALEKTRKQHIDIVLTDFKMPGKTGFDLLKEIRAINPESTVVLMTAFGTIEGAVEAMRAGAFNYLNKPIDLDELDLLIQRIQERTALISENKLLKEQLIEKHSIEGIVSQSPEMETVLNTAARVAESKASVPDTR